MLSAIRALTVFTLILTCVFAFEARATSVASRPVTKIRHTLLVGLTNSVCDSVLSSAQCFETLQLLDTGTGPNFTELSDSKWQHALNEINVIIKSRVSEASEPRRWNAVRKLVLEAYQVNSRYNVSAASPGVTSIPEREPPAAALGLIDHEVSDVDFVHRVLISGNRLLVDHALVDRTRGGEINATVLATSRPTALTTEMPSSLGASIADSMRSLSETATAKLKITGAPNLTSDDR